MTIYQTIIDNNIIKIISSKDKYVISIKSSEDEYLLFRLITDSKIHWSYEDQWLLTELVIKGAEDLIKKFMKVKAFA